MNSSQYSKSDKQLFHDLQSTSFALAAVETFFYLLVLVVGGVGNSAVIWIVYKKRRLVNSTYFLIGSLAFSDVLLFLSAGWESIVVLLERRWVLGHFICQFQGYSVLSLGCASLLTMALTALNRYFKVVRPNNYEKWFAPSRTKLLILSTWVLAYIEPLPYVLSGQMYIFHPGKLFCFQEKAFSITTILPFIYICIPMVVITSCYVLIFKKLRQHQDNIKHLRRGEGCPIGASIEEIKATRTLFLTVVGFMICWAPISIIDIVDFVREDSSMPRQVYVMYTFLGNVSAMINPIIYGVMNRGFRTEYRKLLGWKKERRITVMPLKVRPVS